MTKKTVKLNLGERSYNIEIGSNIINQTLSEFLSSSNYSKIFIISDEQVNDAHGQKIKKLLPNGQLVVIPSGEQAKSFASFEHAAEKILRAGIDRKSLIIAFGGGVVGDLSGFLASTLLRGIDFIQIPTTLLAMVDSSVGGKTAINSKSGKNLIGSFYQPKLVMCDIEFLKTLPIRQIRAGYAEIVKYGLIKDKNFFKFLEKNYQAILDLEIEPLSKAVTRSCEIKAEIVASDEKESSNRALLNFGHTFGHTLETETGYSDILNHGEAVAIGMLMASKMSLNLHKIIEEEFQQIKNHLTKCGFNLDLKTIKPNLNKENLVKHLYKDKKTSGEVLKFILLNTIGRAETFDTKDESYFRQSLDCL